MCASFGAIQIAPTSGGSHEQLCNSAGVSLCGRSQIYVHSVLFSRAATGPRSGGTRLLHSTLTIAAIVLYCWHCVCKLDAFDAEFSFCHLRLPFVHWRRVPVPTRKFQRSRLSYYLRPGNLDSGMHPSAGRSRLTKMRTPETSLIALVQWETHQSFCLVVPFQSPL